jgi:hypothetical protein
VTHQTEKIMKAIAKNKMDHWRVNSWLSGLVDSSVSGMETGLG